MSKRLLEIAAEIVQAQASVGQMAADQIELSLAKTFATLQKMKKAEEEGTLLSVKTGDEAVTEVKAQGKTDPKESIMEEKIVCLECGAEMRQLTTKHLGAHGLSPRDYKEKWGFPLKLSLSAKSLTRARSKAAKKRGLPENLLKYQTERKLMKMGQAPQEAPVVDPVPVPEPSAEKVTATRRPRKKKAE